MNDLISRQFLIEAFKEEFYYMYSDDFEFMIKWFENLPTANTFEYFDKLWKIAYERGKKEASPKKGEWVAFANEGGELDLRCSVCGEEQGFFFGYFNYCPNCGARMEAFNG